MLPNWQLLAEQVLFTSELLSNCIKILHSNNKITQNNLVLTEWAEWRETKKTAIDLIELIVPELRIKSFWQQKQTPIQKLGGFYPPQLPSTIQKHHPVNSSPCIVQEHLWAFNPSWWSLGMQGESKSKHGC